MISTGNELTAPQRVINVIDHLYRDVSVAEAARQGRFTHAGVELQLGRTPDWLNSGLADDVEWRIEWVKLYEGLDLAHAYGVTGEAGYVTAWEDLVESFCEQVAVGVDTSDVSARRLQNWLYAWGRFADAPTFIGLRPGLAARLAQRIADDAEHLRCNLTRHRNHRTLELYALLVVGLSLPDSDPDLARFALDQLGENLLTDVWADGVHRECSTDYHCIVVRSFLGALANARAAGLDLPDGYVEHVSLALDFVLHIQRPDGMTPSFSDGDVVDFRQLLALGAELLDRDDLRWAATGGEAGTPPAQKDTTFPVGGYLTARSGWGEGTTAYSDERFMLMDAGPIGDGGHGHYDQLSIELYAHGHSLVVDPGRYTYADTSWRQWFKGSAAHNTVTVDGLDQTPYRHGSPKAGTSHARLVRRVSRAAFDAIEAQVTSPQHEVVHTRRVLFLQREYWVIHDHMHGDADHRYEARWHLPSEAEGQVTVVRDSNQTTVNTPVGTLAIPACATVEIEPGWLSPSYGILERAPIVVIRANGADADIVTVLSPGDAEVTFDDFTAPGSGSLQCWVTRGTKTDLIQWTAHADVAWERRNS